MRERHLPIQTNWPRSNVFKPVCDLHVGRCREAAGDSSLPWGRGLTAPRLIAVGLVAALSLALGRLWISGANAFPVVPVCVKN